MATAIAAAARRGIVYSDERIKEMRLEFFLTCKGQGEEGEAVIDLDIIHEWMQRLDAAIGAEPNDVRPIS